MPIEIRELVIRAVVEQGAAVSRSSPEPAVARGEQEREALVQACVEQVLRILRRERER